MFVERGIIGLLQLISLPPPPPPPPPVEGPWNSSGIGYENFFRGRIKEKTICEILWAEALIFTKFFRGKPIFFNGRSIFFRGKCNFSQADVLITVRIVSSLSPFSPLLSPCCFIRIQQDCEQCCQNVPSIPRHHMVQTFHRSKPVRILIV